MMQPKYQHLVSNEINKISFDDDKVLVQLITGELSNKEGKITTQTPVNAFMIDLELNGELLIPIKQSHQSILYLLNGTVTVNNKVNLRHAENQIIQFNQDGDHIKIFANEKSKALFLSGEPLKETVATYGPYVMNTQTELLEAMRDYQQGKMGFLPSV